VPTSSLPPFIYNTEYCRKPAHQYLSDRELSHLSTREAQMDSSSCEVVSNTIENQSHSRPVRGHLPPISAPCGTCKDIFRNRYGSKRNTQSFAPLAVLFSRLKISADGGCDQCWLVVNLTSNFMGGSSVGPSDDTVISTYLSDWHPPELPGDFPKLPEDFPANIIPAANPHEVQFYFTTDQGTCQVEPRLYRLPGMETPQS
jgi:hypothetical protein